MSRLLQPLWLLLAAATDPELARMIEYLKAENRILREKLPDRLTVTPRERAHLVKLGQPLGTAINDLITIVMPRTFARWLSGVTPVKKASTRKPGRPRAADDIRELVLRLARENGWGYSRVLGELKKLGIHSVSRTTVANILREAGLDPGPKRGEGTWDEFLTRQAATLWACDFLSVKSWTTSGLVDLYILFFLHVGSRRRGVLIRLDPKWHAHPVGRNDNAVQNLVVLTRCGGPGRREQDSHRPVDRRRPPRAEHSSEYRARLTPRSISPSPRNCLKIKGFVLNRPTRAGDRSRSSRCPS